MKKLFKLLTIVAVVALLATLAVGFAACNNNDGDTLRFTAPQGTPALAMLRLIADNKTMAGYKMQYEVVQPANIPVEMQADKSDIVIMPINAGAKLIKNGKDYKLVSVAVEGSLYVIGKKEGSNALTFNDLKGKRIVSIGKNAVPGLLFEYVMGQKGFEIVETGTPTEHQIQLSYVSAAPYASAKITNNECDYIVVGEPAATQLKGALQLNAEMDLQLEYSNLNNGQNGDTYPQAGLFVRTSLANNKAFMDALFEALALSKEWVLANPDKVTEFVEANMNGYKGVFPAASIPRCAIKSERLTEDAKNEIITFLKYIEPSVNWDSAKEMIF